MNSIFSIFTIIPASFLGAYIIFRMLNSIDISSRKKIFYKKKSDQDLETIALVKPIENQIETDDSCESY